MQIKNKLSVSHEIQTGDFPQFRKIVANCLGRSLPGADGHRLLAPRLEVPRETLRPQGDDYRLGGVLVLFYPIARAPYLVLIQRHQYDGAHSGQISFPGGRYEQPDQNLQITALRETEEEVGVPRQKVEVAGSLSELFIPASNYVVHPFVGFMDHQPAFVPEEKEVFEILEVPFEHFLNADRWKSKKMDLRTGQPVKVPYFDIEGRVLWGATAMILGELLMALGWKPPNV